MSPKGAVIAKFSPLVESEGMPRVVATRVVVTTRMRRHRAIANGGDFAIAMKHADSKTDLHLCARESTREPVQKFQSLRRALKIFPNRFSQNLGRGVGGVQC
jgi:hypothetical protein